MNDKYADSLNLYIALNRAGQWINAHADRDIRQHGLNRTEFGVLDLLYHKGPQPLQQIGGKVLMSSGNITYVIDKLEKKAFVRRNASTEDRRTIYAEITEHGKRFMEQAFPDHAALIDRVLGSLTAEEKTTLSALLKKAGKFAQEEWSK